MPVGHKHCLLSVAHKPDLRQRIMFVFRFSHACFLTQIFFRFFVTDCLHLQLYRDSKDRYKNGQTKASLSLEHFLGVETGFTLDKESNTIAIICQDIIVVLAFDTRERLIQWQVRRRTAHLHSKVVSTVVAAERLNESLPCPGRHYLPAAHCRQ